MNKKLFLSIILTIVATATVASQASAAGYGTPGYGTAGCTPTYGGGTNCTSVKFTIDKLVQTPSSQTKGGQTTGGDFVDNLGVNDAKYAPNSTINFKIKVQNTGTDPISKIDVVDTFPQFLQFTSGVGGTYDKNTRTLKYSINNLAAGATSEVTVVTLAAEAASLPSDKGIVCVVNQVNATDVASGQTSNDSSQVCIEKNQGTFPTPQVFGTPKVTQTPPTGPEMVVLPILSSLGALGVFIRRKARI